MYRFLINIQDTMKTITEIVENVAEKLCNQNRLISIVDRINPLEEFHMNRGTEEIIDKELKRRLRGHNTSKLDMLKIACAVYEAMVVIESSKQYQYTLNSSLLSI
jgi:hypothetical protein